MKKDSALHCPFPASTVILSPHSPLKASKTFDFLVLLNQVMFLCSFKILRKGGGVGKGKHFYEKRKILSCSVSAKATSKPAEFLPETVKTAEGAM